MTLIYDGETLQPLQKKFFDLFSSRLNHKSCWPIENCEYITKSNFKKISLQNKNLYYVLDWSSEDRAQCVLESEESKLIEGALAVVAHTSLKATLLKTEHPLILSQSSLSWPKVSDQKLQVLIHHFRDNGDLLLTLRSLKLLKSLLSLEIAVVSYQDSSAKEVCAEFSTDVKWHRFPVDFVSIQQRLWENPGHFFNATGALLYLESGVELTPKFCLNLLKSLSAPQMSSLVLPKLFQVTSNLPTSNQVVDRLFYVKPSVLPCALFSEMPSALDARAMDLALWDWALDHGKPLPQNDLPIFFRCEAELKNPLFYYHTHLAIEEKLPTEEIPDSIAQWLQTRHTIVTYLVEKHREYFQSQLPAYFASIDMELQNWRLRQLSTQRKLSTAIEKNTQNKSQTHQKTRWVKIKKWIEKTTDKGSLIFGKHRPR